MLIRLTHTVAPDPLPLVLSIFSARRVFRPAQACRIVAISGWRPAPHAQIGKPGGARTDLEPIRLFRRCIPPVSIPLARHRSPLGRLAADRAAQTSLPA